MPEKYQDEIEEILRRSGEAPPLESPSQRPTAPEDSPEVQKALRNSTQSDNRPRRKRGVFSPGKMMLGGLVIFLIGIISGFNPLIWVGLAVLVGAYLLFFIKPSYGSLEKRWRGRLVDEPDSKVGRLKKWLKQ
jgi:hypothetical protein